MNADPPPPPPPWVWMVPGSAGLLRLGAGVAPPPVLLASAQPPAGPPLPGLPAWRAPGESLLPLLPLPAAPDHAAAAAAAAAHRYPALNGQQHGGPLHPREEWTCITSEDVRFITAGNGSRTSMEMVLSEESLLFTSKNKDFRVF
ncbi:hypothetical protein MJG53_018476 [Ovis ammon polii x Ovis aries]|uniref:Uncharacterized protein n=1 Tax=Ovis ammon polii x Ovis aries TaxID=2918886 RepID=A0ACB9U3S1_9CETA|nr:hypothetical protein MJG53_018476 [Ovis ammon polii x Ovis aries]